MTDQALSKSAPKSAEWKAHWTIVLAAFIGFALPSVTVHATGIFIQPLQDEFGWTRAQITAGLTLAGVLTVPLSPFVGALIDRWGSRALAIPGVLLTSCALASFSLANGSMVQWMALWTVYALVALMAKSTVWTAAINGAFDKGRGLALALTLCGTAFAQMVTPPLAHMLEASFGWRMAFVGLGVIWGVPTVLLVLFFLRDVARDTRTRQMARDGYEAPVAALPGLTIGQAARHPALIRLGIATLITLVLASGMVVHKVPLLVEAGVSRGNAAWLAGMGGIAAIAGKVVTGWLMDRFHAGTIGAVTIAISALAFLALLEPFRTPTLIVLSMFVISYGGGTSLQVCAYLTGVYGGMRNFGKIFGVMASIVALSSGIGPMLTGHVRDVAGSYTPIIWASMIVGLVGAALLVGLGKYPDWRAGETGDSPRPRPLP